ncbi:MAG: hypothetical protein NTV51_16710 [Verrucomicrobia bacterium]|nr:hypothetical protein [Verrucomicrobiota bacterium]
MNPTTARHRFRGEPRGGSAVSLTALGWAGRGASDQHGQADRATVGRALGPEEVRANPTESDQIKVDQG